jgi:hypothetical protein
MAARISSPFGQPTVDVFSRGREDADRDFCGGIVLVAEDAREDGHDMLRAVASRFVGWISEAQSADA